MAAVSLLVFFWRVLLGSSGVLLGFFCVIEHQKNARRTPEEPRRRRTPAPP
jgi:hypothetical protein